MFFGKNSASESNESLLSNCRAQPVLFKNFASESNENPLSYCRAQPVLFKNHNWLILESTNDKGKRSEALSITYVIFVPYSKMRISFP